MLKLTTLLAASAALAFGAGRFRTTLKGRGLNRGAELAAQADLMLGRYPADVREQITELLRVLAAKPGEAEIQSSVG